MTNTVKSEIESQGIQCLGSPTDLYRVFLSINSKGDPTALLLIIMKKKSIAHNLNKEIN
jgi:hypothetical protein